jgi:hypothetical protein
MAHLRGNREEPEGEKEKRMLCEQKNGWGSPNINRHSERSVVPVSLKGNLFRVAPVLHLVVLFSYFLEGYPPCTSSNNTLS